METEETSAIEWFTDNITVVARDPFSGVIHVRFDPDDFPPSVVLLAAPALVHEADNCLDPSIDPPFDVDALDAYLQSLSVPGGILVTFEDTTCLVHGSGHLMAWKSPGVHQFELLGFGLRGTFLDVASADAEADE